MEIRKAKVEDAWEIAWIHVHTWRVAYAGIVPVEFLALLSVEKNATFWEKELASGGSTTLVAVDEGQMLGWVSGGVSRDADAQDASEIYALYVSPEHWRHTVGRALVESIERVLPPGLDVTLWVLRENARAISFYEKVGYGSDAAEKSVQIGSQTLGEIRLRKGG